MVPTAKEPPAVAGPSTPAPEALRPLAGRRRRSEELPAAQANPLAAPPVVPARRIAAAAPGAEDTEVTRAVLTATARRIPTGREGEEAPAPALGAEEAAVLAAPRINSALEAALAGAIVVAVGVIAAAVAVIEGAVEVWVVIGVVEALAVVTVAAAVPVAAGETTVTVEVTAVITEEITEVITARMTSTVTEKKKATTKVGLIC